MIANWGWVFLGNLLGSIAYGVLLAIVLTNFWHTPPTGVAARIVATAEAKTIGYEALGAAGMTVAFVKAMLCNWLVCLGVVMAMTSSSTIGKLVGAWLPISVFFAQGFEHTVVNMFIIPTGMLMGAKVTVSDWWLWNQIPVTLGNLVGGFVVHRPCPLRHLQAGDCAAARVQFHVRSHGVQGSGRVTRQPTEAIADREHEMADIAPSAEFSDEQKRYLEGFASGLNVGRAAHQLSAARVPAAAPAKAPSGAGRTRCGAHQGAGPRARGGQEALRPGKVQARAQSARRL